MVNFKEIKERKLNAQEQFKEEYNKLSKGQRRAFDDALSGKNMFITSAGGVGKSHLVHLIQRELQKAGRGVALTSSTGISALNIGGSTIHSFCGTGLRSTIQELRTVSPEAIAKMRNYNGSVDVVIIDEISMLSGDYIDMLDAWFQRIWKNKSAFGGRQVIFVGDFLQLPPVITKEDEVFYHFAFESDAWLKYDIKEHFLTKVFRQENKQTQYYLNCVRFGKITDDVIKYFNSRVGAKLDDPEPTELYPLKSSVSNINFQRLDALKGKEYEYDAVFEGDEKWQEAIAKNTIAEVCLYLKEGAQVLFIRNNPQEGYYNGTKGVVKSCDETSVTVEIVGCGREVTVERCRWEKKNKHDEVMAAMEQIPLILGWAITIHKSQGMTLEYMSCDLSLCFESGQAYVALSRMKSIEGLSIKKKIHKSCIKTNKKVIKFYRDLLTRLREEKEQSQV